MIIGNEQFEAFRGPARKVSRARLIAGLRANPGLTVTESDRMVRLQDGRGRASSLHFSEQNLMQAYEKPSGARYEFEYDKEDRFRGLRIPGREYIGLEYRSDRPSAIVSAGIRLELQYDEAGRLSRILYPDRTTIRFEYSGQALSAIINRAGEKHHFSSAQINGQSIHRLIDALGKETVLIVDSQGALEKIELPDGTGYSVRYDEELGAEIIRLRNGTEKITTFQSYDSVRSDWEDGCFQELEFNSDKAVTRLENEAGVLQFGYGAGQQLLSESFEEQEIRYEYDGELLRRIAYPGGLVVDYGYDEDDRLVRLTVGDAVCSFSYDANSTISEIRYPSGCREVQRSLVLSGQKEAVLYSEEAIPLLKLSYGYDPLGRLSTYTQHWAGQPAVKRILSYDNADRLTRVADGAGAVTESFQYNANGSMVAAGSRRITVGLLDEVRSIGGQAVTYDKGGNVSGFLNERGQPVGLQYRDNGTLKAAFIGKERWDYAYDGLGRRIRKSNGKETATFFWSGDRLLMEELSKDGERICREYIYTDSNVPVAFREGDALYWLQRDVRGAVVAVHDQSGRIVWQATYDSFGQATVTEGHIRQPWRLAGQYCDEETGLHYSLARYYSPYLKSFLSLDPHWLEYGVGNYSYAGNDPYNRIDEDGSRPKWLNGAIAIGASIAVGAIVAATLPISGSTLLGLVAIGAISGAASGAAGPIVESLLDGKPVCWPCVLKNAALGAVLGAIMGPLLGLLGKALSSFGRALNPKSPAVAKFIAKTATKAQKGVFGEARTDEIFSNAKGYSKLNGPRVEVGDLPRGHGIDHIYHNPDKVPPYFIVESKFGSAGLNKLSDRTRQMSKKWIDDRLEAAVGKKTAHDIMKRGYSQILNKVDSKGNCTMSLVDKDGFVIKGGNGIFRP